MPGGVPMSWMTKWPGAYPLFVKSAKGAHFKDVDGNSYIDFCLGDTGSMTGHSPAATVEAIKKQLNSGLTAMLPTEDALAVSEDLTKRFGLPMWQFTVSATEIMVLLAFQVVFGYFYKDAALLIAAFMAGLTMGTYLSGKDYLKYSRNKILINQALIGFSAFVIPLFLVFEARNFESEFLLHLIFYFLMIIPGILTGIQFSRISMMVGKENSDNGAAAYSADLMGSAGGAILASAILIPLAGFLWTGLVLFGMNVLIILVNVIRKI
jgi:hypothetical protein